MSEVTGSTVPRRQLGRYLREMRQQARFTIAAAAGELEWSPTRMHRIEMGQTGIRAMDVKNMMQVYGADPEMLEPLQALAKESKQRGWWHSYGDVIPDGFDLYIGLEEAASQFRSYEAELVPGIFQTEDYARAVISGHNPDQDDDETDRRVSLRIKRQSILTRTVQPRWDVVLNEAFLRRPVGSPAVMAAQLDRLREVADLDNVNLSVIPYSAGFHPGITVGTFILLSFPMTAVGRPSEPDTVYVELFTGALYLDEDPKVEKYRAAFTRLQASALDEKGSKTMLAQAAKDMRR